MKKYLVFCFFYFMCFVLFAQSNDTNIRIIIDTLINSIGSEIPNGATRLDDGDYYTTTQYRRGNTVYPAYYFYKTRNGRNITQISYTIDIYDPNVSEQENMRNILLYSLLLSIEIEKLNGIVERNDGGFYYRGIIIGAGRNELAAFITVMRN